MIAISSINSLSWRKFKSCSYGGIENNEGYNDWVTETGYLSNIIRWRDHKFTLLLQNLTRDELKEIVLELQEAEQANYRALIYKSKIENVGYIDFKEIENDPVFIFKFTSIGVSRHVNSDRWQLSIPLIERVIL